MDILVVEDNPLIREAVAADLQQAGFQIEEAVTAEAALAAIEKAAAGSGPPFVVVTDLRLGAGMDGLALGAEVQRRWPEVSVVYMTGHPDSLDGHLLGPREHYVVKPFPAETLRHVVRRLTPALVLGRMPPLAGLGQVVAAALGLSGPRGP